MAVGVNKRLESAQMAPEEKASAKVVVEESIQTTMKGIQANVEALSSASPEPKADLQQKLQQALECEQEHLTSFVDQLHSPEQEKEEISSMLSSRFAEVRKTTLSPSFHYVSHFILSILCVLCVVWIVCIVYCVYCMYCVYCFVLYGYYMYCIVFCVLGRD